MKRFHVHVAVDDLETNVRFYSTDKYWVTDPQGIAWETYRTLAEAEIFGADTRKAEKGGACCSPRPQAIAIIARDAPTAKCC